ncbi:fibrous sheath CABYR-binding protein-like [Liolophura sinensis]|uniref:fibrous sheath CABYR-binding protein-like n=1 Tax=Liolophura sinensis TaxID=3198878 RepID=UPI0031594BAE
MPRRRSAAVESPASRKSPRAAAQAQAKTAESPASTRGSRSRSASSSNKAEKSSPAPSTATTGRGSRSRSRAGKVEENVEANEEVVEEKTPRGRASRRGVATKEEVASPSPRGKGRLTRGGLQEEKKAAAKPQKGGRGRSRGRGKKQEEEPEEEVEAEEEGPVEEEETSAVQEEETPAKTTPSRGGRGRGKQAKEQPAEEAEKPAEEEEETSTSRGRRSRGGQGSEKKVTPPKVSPRSRRGKVDTTTEEANPEATEEPVAAKEEPSPKGRRSRGRQEPAAETVKSPKGGSRRAQQKEETGGEEVDASVEEAMGKTDVTEDAPEKTEKSPEKSGPSEVQKVDPPAVVEEAEAEEVPSGIETPPEEVTPAEHVPDANIAEEEQMEVDAAVADQVPAELAAPEKAEVEMKPEVATAPLPTENIAQLSPPAEEIADAPVEDAAPLPSEQVSEASVPVAVEISATVSSGSAAPAVVVDSPNEVKLSPSIPEQTLESSSQPADLPGIVSISPPVDEVEAVGPSSDAVQAASFSPPPENVQVTAATGNNITFVDTASPPVVVPIDQSINQESEPIVPSRKRSYEDETEEDDLSAKKAKVGSQQEDQDTFEVVETPSTLANGSQEPQEKAGSQQVEPDIVEVQPVEVQQRDAGATIGEGDFNVNMSVEPSAPSSTAQEALDGSGATKEDDILKEYVVIEMSDVPEANSGPVQEATPSKAQLSTVSGTSASSPPSTESSRNHVSQTLSSSEKDPLFNRLYLTNPTLQSDCLVPAKQFSVVSYNILADCWLNRFADTYTHASPKAKDPSYRHSRLLEEIKYLDADIVCMQEVDIAVYEGNLLPAMTGLGYEGTFKSRAASEGFQEGEATFFKNSRFTLLQSEGYFLKDLAEKEIESSALPDDVRECIRKYINLPDVVVITNLQCKLSSNPVTVGNIHVNYGGFKIPNAQCIQISCAIKELVGKASNGNFPHIICGDFNSAPDTPGYQLARDGYLSDEMIQKLQSSEDMEMPDGSKSALVNHLWRGFQHTSSTLKSAYSTVQGAEPNCTALVNPIFRRCLDYIFYSSNSLDTVGVLKVASEEDITANTALPSEIFPSDHLSLKAVLSFK